ncbi:MAG: hypothetical protein ACKOE7_02320, partial [Actinomycetota bacterium]
MRYDIEPPFLLPGRVVVVPGRGEFFVRHHQHADPNAPVVLLLHGWTASSDLNFFTAYEEFTAPRHDHDPTGQQERGLDV